MFAGTSSFPFALEVLEIPALFTGDLARRFEFEFEFPFELAFDLSNGDSDTPKDSFTGEAGIDDAAVSDEAFDEVELNEYIELPEVDRDDVDTEAREDADVDSRLLPLPLPSLVVEVDEEAVEKENDDEPYLDIVEGRRGVAFM